MEPCPVCAAYQNVDDDDRQAAREDAGDVTAAEVEDIAQRRAQERYQERHAEHLASQQ